MEHFEHKNKGTCSVRVEFDLDGDIVKNVRFLGGCDGNLKAVSKLVDGMKAEDVISKLEGNTCGFKNTSCADQLAKAIKEAAASK